MPASGRGGGRSGPMWRSWGWAGGHGDLLVRRAVAGRRPWGARTLTAFRGTFYGQARTRTGGGGIHVFFRYPGSTEIRNSAGLLGPGLDVRGEGGYIVVPPSRTQGPYEWVDRSPLAEASWLIDRLTERDGATLF